MQTYLEKTGIEQRDTLENLPLGNGDNSYNKNDVYSELHKNAISDGDEKGKGTGWGGHTHSIPDANKGKGINYSAFNLEGGGGKYDVEGGYRGKDGGRNYLKTISKYSENYEYGANLVDTTVNRQNGQIVI